MAAIKAELAQVFYAPTKRRRYLTSMAAANGEAAAHLEQKYPTEHAEYGQGRMYYPGYHWSSDEQLVRVHKRYARLLLRALRKEQS